MSALSEISRRIRIRHFWPAAAALALAAAAWAQPSPGDPPVRPATAEEQDRVIKFGSPLPGPEFLQPTLDPKLAPYRPRPDLKLRGHLQGNISDNAPALAKMWIEAFRAYYPDVTLDVPPPFGGSGTQKLMAGQIDFAIATRELFPSETGAFRQKFGYEPLCIPISGGTYRHFEFLDAIVFVVNKDNPIEKLTFTQIDGIISSTRHRGSGPLTTWGQLGLTGEWADKPIHAWGMKPHAGFEEFIIRRIMNVGDKRGEWGKDFHFAETIFPVVDRVGEDRYAIGYTAKAYIRGPVKILAVAENDAGPYHKASYEEVALATYPLSRVFYVDVNKAPGKPLDPVLGEFVRFLLSKEGQAIILKQAVFIPLRSEQVEKSEAMLSR